MFLPVTHCLPSRITLLVPACFPPSIPVCFPCSILPWHRTGGFLVAAGLQRAGSCRLGCGLVVWELPASVSMRRMPGPFGRGKGVRDTRFQFSFQIKATCERETLGQQSTFFLVPDDAIRMSHLGSGTCVHLVLSQQVLRGGH